MEKSNLRGHQGFSGAGEKGYIFSGSWGALAIIFRGAGEQAHTFGDLGRTAKKAGGKSFRDLGRSEHCF